VSFFKKVGGGGGSLFRFNPDVTVTAVSAGQAVDLAGPAYPDLQAPLRTQRDRPRPHASAREVSLERVSEKLNSRLRQKYMDYCDRLKADDPSAVAVAEEVFLSFFNTCLDYKLGEPVR
jgi:hypothetical protein